MNEISAIQMNVYFRHVYNETASDVIILCYNYKIRDYNELDLSFVINQSKDLGFVVSRFTTKGQSCTRTVRHVTHRNYKRDKLPGNFIA